MQLRTLVTAAVVVLAATGCGVLDAGGESSSTTVTSVPSSVPPLASSTTTAAQVEPEDWAAAYEWTETAADGSSSTRRLVLDVPPGSTTLAGTYVEEGSVAPIEVPVTARTGRDWVSITVAPGGGTERYQEGEILFTLTGGPDDPITVLDAAAPMRADQPTSGSYFQRPSPAADGGSATTPPEVEVEEERVARGDRGELVAAWQEDLATWAELTDSEHHPLAVDGVFGPGTEAATSSFETAAGRPVDGVVDADDRRAMVLALTALGAASP